MQTVLRFESKFSAVAVRVVKTANAVVLLVYENILPLRCFENDKRHSCRRFKEIGGESKRKFFYAQSVLLLFVTQIYGKEALGQIGKSQFLFGVAGGDFFFYAVVQREQNAKSQAA